LRFAGVLGAFALAACSNASNDGHVGRIAPNWTEPTASGTKLSLASLRGKVVYLNFFATWCPPCNQEAPWINALQKKYAARGVQVVGVDELEGVKQAQAFVRKYGLIYPAVVDSDGTIGSQYEVNGLPVHVFIRRNGMVAKIVIGEMSKAQIISDIRGLLHG
jgi:cytochrome c biogenesis protein CcmG/thiol:disulfide interchange protein DsbE